MDAKEYLRQYAALRMETQGHESRIMQAQCKTEMPAAGESDGSQHQPGKGDRHENAVISWMEVKAEYQPLIDANREKMRVIREKVNALVDPQQREILRLRYIDNDGWKPAKIREVAMQMYRSDDEATEKQVKRLHSDALQALADILEKEKSHL